MPLTFDMPLEALYTYGGRNPKPVDFDQYWQRGLEEMKATDPEVILEDAEFQTDAMRCRHLYFTGVRGARIHAKVVTARNRTESGPALLRFHGYSMSSGDWSDAFSWAAHGFTVVSLDCRGQGGLSEDVGGTDGTTLSGHIIRGLNDDPDNLLFRQIFLDTAQLAGITAGLEGVDKTRIHATGGSQGGGLTLACAALAPEIVKAAPIFPFLCDYQRIWEMDMAKDAYDELKQYFRRFDPRHERESDIFGKLGYIDVQHLASWIKAEILMAVALSDTICPPSTQFAAYNKIKSDKSLKLYHDFGHENLPEHNDELFRFFCRK